MTSGNNKQTVDFRDVFSAKSAVNLNICLGKVCQLKSSSGTEAKQEFLLVGIG